MTLAHMQLGAKHDTVTQYSLSVVDVMFIGGLIIKMKKLSHARSQSSIVNPFKPEFTIVIFIEYKQQIAVAILGLYYGSVLCITGLVIFNSTKLL